MKQQNDIAIEHACKRMRQTAQEQRRHIARTLEDARKTQFHGKHLRKGISCVRKLRFINGETVFNLGD